MIRPATILYGIIAINLPILLILLSVRLVMTPLFLQFEYTRSGFPDDIYGFTTEDRLQYGPLGVEYLLNNESIDFLKEQRLPIEKCWNPPSSATTDCAMFNSLELRHMEDVKIVTSTAFIISVIVGVVTITAGLWMLKTNPQQLWRALFSGSMLTLAIIIGIVVIAVAMWQRFFDLFHELLFEDGTWQFFYSDTLIRLYPEQFWFDAALTIGAITVTGAILIATMAWRRR